MKDTSSFKIIVDKFNKRLLQVSDMVAGKKLSEESWSLKEIIGHLIDSASNNHQRFVRLQFDNLLGFPSYDGEQWIKAQRYNDMEWQELISLWYSYNCILLKVIGHMSIDSLENGWAKEEKIYPLRQLVDEYYWHMEWHINHFESRLEEINFTEAQK